MFSFINLLAASSVDTALHKKNIYSIKHYDNLTNPTLCDLFSTSYDPNDYIVEWSDTHIRYLCLEVLLEG